MRFVELKSEVQLAHKSKKLYHPLVQKPGAVKNPSLSGSPRASGSRVMANKPTLRLVIVRFKRKL